MTEEEIAKITLCGVRLYLTSIVKQVMDSVNPELTLYGQYSHIASVVQLFDKDPELEAFIREIGYNAKFMNMFRDVSDMIQGFKRNEY